MVPGRSRYNSQMTIDEMLTYAQEARERAKVRAEILRSCSRCWSARLAGSRQAGILDGAAHAVQKKIDSRSITART